MSVIKHVVLSGAALKAFDKLKGEFPFVSDSHLIRAALLIMSESSIDEVRKACEVGMVKVGRSKKE